MRIELTPVYDRRKSFYKKAYVETTEEGEKHLFSYDTLVATIKADGSYILHTYAACSVTTRRHVCDFLYQNGHKPLCKKDMEAQIIREF